MPSCFCPAYRCPFTRRRLAAPVLLFQPTGRQRSKRRDLTRDGRYALHTFPPEESDDEGYLATEAPLGQSGAHIVSRGDRTPWRLHLRTPSFATVSSLPAVLPGVRVQDLEVALASLGHVVGDIDR